MATYHRQETMDAVDNIANKRSRADGDFEGGDNWLELANSVYRYAFNFNKFDVFRNKQAIKWANLQLFSNSDRDSVLFARYASNRMPAAVLGSYYRDPVFKYYEEKALGSKWGRKMFIDRYPCGISAYNNDLQPKLPTRDFKVHLMPYSPYDANHSGYLAKLLKKYPELKKKKPQVAVILKNGWNDNFSVIGISGSDEVVRAGTGEITHLSFEKRNFLSSAWNAIYNYNTALPFEQNTLQITRANQKDNAADERPRAGFLEWDFNVGGRQGACLLFRDLNGALWRRTILSHGVNQYIVHDSVVAEEDDLYDISVVWRPLGQIRPATADTLYTMNGGRFAINLSGKGFKLKTNTAAYLNKEAEKLLSLFSFHGKLNKGQTVTASALLQFKKDAKIHDCGNGRILISNKGKVTAEITILPDGFVEITETQIIASNVTEVKVGNSVIKVSDKVTNVAWFFPNGNCYRDKAGYRKVPAAECKAAQDICRNYLASLKIPEAAVQGANAAAVEKRDSFKSVWKKNIFAVPEVFNQLSIASTRIDIGRVAEVIYMRNLTQLAPLPEWMEYSVDDKNYQRFELKNVKWQPGIWTHNYGNIQLRDKWFMDTELPKLKARYFRFPTPVRPQFHLGDRLVPLRPVKILETEPFILASNEVVKIYPRGYQWDNTVYGAFDYQGNELFVKKQQQAPLDIKITDFPAKNTVAVTDPDGIIHFLDRNGRELMTIDNIQAMQDFHRKWGKSNTRHPAGGFPATYAVGSWQNGISLVAGHYGQTAFFTSDGKMTGLRAAGTYNINFILPRGIDFDGDGKDEILGMANSYLIHYFGDAKESPPYPGATWPQVYDVVQTMLPRWWNISYGVWGPKFSCFKAIPFGGKTRHAAGISRIHMFIYNAATRKMAWTLKFSNPSTAGDICEVGGIRWIGAVAFDDGVITVYEWLDPDKAPRVIASVSLDDEARAIAVSRKGRVFVAGGNGIYEIAGEKIIRHIDGAFTDIRCHGDELVTADVQGSVSIWKE